MVELSVRDSHKPGEGNEKAGSDCLRCKGGSMFPEDGLLMYSDDMVCINCGFREDVKRYRERIKAIQEWERFRGYN